VDVSSAVVARRDDDGVTRGDLGLEGLLEGARSVVGAIVTARAQEHDRARGVRRGAADTRDREAEARTELQILVAKPGHAAPQRAHDDERGRGRRAGAWTRFVLSDVRVVTDGDGRQGRAVPMPIARRGGAERVEIVGVVDCGAEFGFELRVHTARRRVEIEQPAHTRAIARVTKIRQRRVHARVDQTDGRALPAQARLHARRRQAHELGPRFHQTRTRPARLRRGQGRAQARGRRGLRTCRRARPGAGA